MYGKNIEWDMHYAIEEAKIPLILWPWFEPLAHQLEFLVPFESWRTEGSRGTPLRRPAWNLGNKRSNTMNYGAQRAAEVCHYSAQHGTWETKGQI